MRVNVVRSQHLLRVRDLAPDAAVDLNSASRHLANAALCVQPASAGEAPLSDVNRQALADNAIAALLAAHSATRNLEWLALAAGVPPMLIAEALK